MIVLLSDFGVHDPYVGQLHAVFAQTVPQVPVVDLFHTLPNFDIQAAAYLLPAYTSGLAKGTVVLAVVDPGVGGSRRAIMLCSEGVWFVGPDNGLFEILARRNPALSCYEILWRPANLSASFHGRDCFAPVAAQLALGQIPESRPSSLAKVAASWPDELNKVVYIDHYGNCMTGVRADKIATSSRLRIAGHDCRHARVFSDVEKGELFWYGNANGLVEIAMNQARAAQALDIGVGAAFEIISTGSNDYC